MNKKILVLASIFGALAVILGALGAHALKEQLGEGIKNFETAVKYHFFHVFAILYVQLIPQFSIKQKNLISLLFFIGILFFSGSLYVITTGLIAAKSIWFITPMGGLTMIIGWCIMAYYFWKSNI